MKELNFVSCVVYLHGIYAQENIQRFVSTLSEHFLCNFSQYEVIFVNDDLEKKTLDSFCNLLKEKIKSDYISVIDMASFSGIESSMLAGDDLSIGDYIFEFDSIYIDYPEDMLMRVYSKCMEGYDIVSAVPLKNRHSFSKLFYKIYNLGVTPQERIYSEAFRVISRRAYNRVSDLGKTIPYRKPFYASCGLKRSTISYDNKNIRTKEHFDSMQISNRIHLGIDSLIIFTHSIQKLSFVASMFFLLLTIVMGARSIFTHFTDSTITEGWASTILYLSIGFFGIFLLLTIVLNYLSVAINIILKNKNYHIESIKKLSN